MTDIQHRLNKTALNDILKTRNLTQATVAERIGVNEKSFSRWVNDGYIQSKYLLNLTEELDLNDNEMKAVLLLPTYKVFFRKKYLGEVPSEIEERAIELSKTLFNMTYLNSESRFCPPNVSKLNSEMEVANQIRRYTEIDSFKNLQNIISNLAEQGLEVVVVPFIKLGLNSHGEYESAFTVTDEKRCVIFLDAESAEELLIFNLCHELCHLFRPDLPFSKIEEKFCNSVASELVYPLSFFENHRTTIEKIISSNEGEQIISLLNAIKENLGGEIFGIALRLKSLGLLSQKDPLHQKIIGYSTLIYKNSPKLSQTIFNNYNPAQSKMFTEFWDSEDINKTSLLRFFFLLKNSAISGSISPRKFAELLNVDIGVSDEMFHAWKKKLHQSLEG